MIWRLRNRLIVAYAFIAMVPIALILALVAVSTYGVTGQIALYLVNSELDRRTNILRGAAAAIAEIPQAKRPEMIAHTDDFTRRLFPATQVLVRDGAEYRYPESSDIAPPPAGWKDKDANGIVVKDGKLYSWALASSRGTTVEIMAPLHQDFLSNLVPGLGDVDFRVLSERAGPLKNGLSGVAPAAHPARIPPKNNLFDVQVTGAAPVPVMFWDSAGLKENRGLLLVHTRISAVLGTVFGSNIILGELALWAGDLDIISGDSLAVSDRGTDLAGHRGVDFPHHHQRRARPVRGHAAGERRRFLASYPGARQRPACGSGHIVQP